MRQQLLHIRKGNSICGGETRQSYHCEGQGFLDVLREAQMDGTQSCDKRGQKVET